MQLSYIELICANFVQSTLKAVLFSLEAQSEYTKKTVILLRTPC